MWRPPRETIMYWTIFFARKTRSGLKSIKMDSSDERYDLQKTWCGEMREGPSPHIKCWPHLANSSTTWCQVCNLHFANTFLKEHPRSNMDSWQRKSTTVATYLRDHLILWGRLVAFHDISSAPNWRTSRKRITLSEAQCMEKCQVMLNLHKTGENPKPKQNQRFSSHNFVGRSTWSHLRFTSYRKHFTWNGSSYI